MKGEGRMINRDRNGDIIQIMRCVDGHPCDVIRIDEIAVARKSMEGQEQRVSPGQKRAGAGTGGNEPDQSVDQQSQRVSKASEGFAA